MAVAENRALLLDAAGLGSTRLLTLNQVHGDVVLSLDDDAAAAWEAVARAGAAGADGVAVAAPDVTALLCFADCTPVIVVSPSGRIASSGECTACRDDLYFSYRKSGGRCGRHSAFAGRKE